MLVELLCRQLRVVLGWWFQSLVDWFLNGGRYGGV